LAGTLDQFANPPAMTVLIGYAGNSSNARKTLTFESNLVAYVSKSHDSLAQELRTFLQLDVYHQLDHARVSSSRNDLSGGGALCAFKLLGSACLRKASSLRVLRIGVKKCGILPQAREFQGVNNDGQYRS
jgi:hypothetical protein